MYMFFFFLQQNASVSNHWPCVSNLSCILAGKCCHYLIKSTAQGKLWAIQYCVLLLSVTPASLSKIWLHFSTIITLLSSASPLRGIPVIPLKEKSNYHKCNQSVKTCSVSAIWYERLRLRLDPSATFISPKILFVQYLSLQWCGWRHYKIIYKQLWTKLHCVPKHWIVMKAAILKPWRPKFYIHHSSELHQFQPPCFWATKWRKTMNVFY